MFIDASIKFHVITATLVAADVDRYTTSLTLFIKRSVGTSLVETLKCLSIYLASCCH